jgi:rhamnulokinase
VKPDLFVAVDLGAGSGRVMLGGVGQGELLLEEVHRFAHPLARRDGHLRWDFGHIWREATAGLRTAGARARALGRPVRSVGVDTWGVDYGLLDGDGRLIEDPVSYRDERTEHAIERLSARVPRDEIFARTGIQFHVINTLFQLEAHARAGLPPAAARLLLMPDLLHHRLSGRAACEYTNATTTQLLDARSRAWDVRLCEAAGVPARLLPEIVAPGTDLGPLEAALARELGLEGARVVAPATHDTASAVAGAPLEPGWAYISSGTWSLVGVERGGVLIDAEVARANFTNEGGAFGTIRFLKNVMGMWLLERCREEWRREGADVDLDRLLAEVARREDQPGLVFPDDRRLFNPPSMRAALNAQLVETGQASASDPVTLAKIVLDSLALRCARVLEETERLTGERPPGVQVVGGGSRNDYVNQTLATAAGRPVRAGPVEATALGNVLVQAIAAGGFASLALARAHVRAHVAPRVFEPRPTAAFAAAQARYRALEERVAS